MDWTQTSEDLYQRELGGEEKVYRKLCTAFTTTGREHWGIYCVCQLSVDNVDTTHESYASPLRNVWKRLAVEHPNLLLTVAGSYKSFNLPSHDTIEQWASETFQVEHSQSVDDLIKHYQYDDVPKLYYFPFSSTVLLKISHWRIDAVGCCLLLDRFFSKLTSNESADADIVTWETVRNHLSPSLEDAACCPQTATPEIQDFTDKFLTRLYTKKSSMHALPLKSDLTTPPGQCAQEQLIFGEGTTAVMVAACRSQGISITAAIHTALASAVFQLSSPDQFPDDYTLVLSVNLRKYLLPEYRTPEHACQTYVTSITPSVERGRSFREVSQALMRDYKDYQDEMLLKSLRCIYEKHAANVSKPPPASGSRPLPPSGLFLSSLGVIERNMAGHYGSGVRVNGFRFGVSILTRQILVYPWTFQDQLHLAVNYNQAYYSHDSIYQFLLRIRSVLVEGLEIGLEEVNTDFVSN